LREETVPVLQFIAVTWLAFVCIAPACAEKRLALVIGNDRYASLAANEQLQKAVNDARAVGAALRHIGFDVISGENLGRQAVLARLDEAAQRIAPGDTVFFFFSGHGIAVDGFNYILPADVPAVGSGQVASLTGGAIKEEDIAARLLRAGARVTVVVLDACRNNPYASAGTKGVGGDKGLAPHEPASGVFTLYAASRGEAALDRLYDGDRNPNSVFTRVLLPALTRPDLDLPMLAREVREEVTRLARTVNHAQRPAYYDETSGDRIFLAAPLNGPLAPPAFPSKPSDDIGRFVSTILGNLDREWTDIFRQDGQTYRKPILVLYNGQTAAACGGVAQSAMGPFYCPEDQKVYLDASFFKEIETRFRGCEVSSTSCQFAQAYVIGHEISHHVQNLLGIVQKVQQAQARLDKISANQLHVQLELQADCIAGVWAGHENNRLQHEGKPPLVEPGEVEAALRTAAAVGDATLQRKAAGRVVPDSFTHGTSEQRQRWFSTGFREATVAACNTFRAG
jgi:predicted metalloprotease